MSSAIVIPTFNRPDDLERTVRGIIGLLGSDVRMIIVDDASDDSAHHRLLDGLEAASDWISVIRLARSHGCTRARTAALDSLDVDYALLLDDDSYPREPRIEMIGEIERRFEAEPRLGVQAFPVIVPNGRAREADLEKQFSDGRIVSHFTNCACAIRMAAYHDVGGYRSDFDSPYGEEGDLCMRLILRRWVVKQFAKPVVIHQESPVSRSLEDIFRARTYNTLRFIWWYLPAWLSLPYAARILANRLRTSLRYVDSPRPVWLGVGDFAREARAGMTRTPVPPETLKVFFGVRFKPIFSEDQLPALTRRSWTSLYTDYMLARDDASAVDGAAWRPNGETGGQEVSEASLSSSPEERMRDSVGRN